MIKDRMRGAGLKPSHRNRPKKLNVRIPRRTFIKRSALAGVTLSMMPHLITAPKRTSAKNRYQSGIPEGDQKWQTLSAFHEHIFPKTAKSPGAQDIHATRHVQNILFDPEFDPEIREFMLNGIRWLDESSVEWEGQRFIALNESQKERVVKQITQESWGENWVSINLNYIFEALLGHPHYHVNPKGIGWKWLKHDPGFPQPGPGQIFGKMRYRPL
ncbi:MAG: hypothetical protein GF313_15800 [Caldithrix sp.]|nr:hypothetical protein [Caldithrix sp.]